MLGGLVLKRLLQAIPVLFGVSVITFLLLNLLPGNTALAILGSSATRQSVATLQRELGLNQPLVARYGEWLWALLRGDLGHSLVTSQSVASVLGQRFPVTFELVLLAFCFALIFAIPFAVGAANKQGGAVERLSSLLAMIGLSIPNFVIGLVLIIVLSVRFSVFPATGFVPLSAGLWPNLRTMILPALSMSAVLFATYSRMLRADMVDQLLGEDYVAVARAKGISRRRVLVRHVLRNSLFSLITLIGVNFGTILGATVIVESVFALPGIGQLLVSSIQEKDATMVQGIVLVMAVAVVLINLCTDVLYSVLDPRVRYGRPNE